MIKMRFAFALLSSFILVAGCQNNPNQLDISWEVITNNYENSNSFLSELKVINNSNYSLKNNWELFFDYSAGRRIDTSALPKEIRISHINGDFYRLYPTQYFTQLGKNDTLVIPIKASEWVINESGSPEGFYFIFDKNDNQIIKPGFKILPFTRKEQSYRTSHDVIDVPTAESIYKKNQELSILSEDKISKITPTPLYSQLFDKKYILNNNTLIYYEKEFEDEANYLQSVLFETTGLKLSLSPELSKDKNVISLKKYSSRSLTNEAYELNVTESNIDISAASNSGVFYGIQSLRALIPIQAYTKSESNIEIQGITVKDSPEFSYRGMHLDVARNFHAKESVLKLLDLMSFYKLNKLHFHLTDDEGWRIQIPGLPELTEIGAVRGHTRDEADKLIHMYGSATTNSGSGFYTKEDFIEILRFATLRHIEIIPEIDMPGHARAAIKSMRARYNNYNNSGDSTKARQYLLNDPDDKSIYNSVQNFNDNVVCVCQESTYNFLNKVVDEIVKMYHEAGAPITTIHTGGDEVPVGVWEKSPVCQKFFENELNLKPQKLKEYFLDRFSEIIHKHGLRTAGWEEIALHLEILDGEEHETKTVNRDNIEKDFLPYVWNSVYGWGGEETAYKLANAGYKIILCNVTHLYLDMAYNKNPEEPGFYWGGFVTDEHPYLFEPYNIYNSIKTDLDGNTIPSEVLATKTKLTDLGKKNILGMQGHLWSETVKTPERMEYMIFPRIISLAERAWASKPNWTKDKGLYLTAWNEFANRLGQREVCRLDYLHGGINYHIPTPGAIAIDGKLYANTGFPGMQIRYTTDGSIPNSDSPLYSSPIKLSGVITLCTFAKNGRKSLAIKLKI